MAHSQNAQTTIVTIFRHISRNDMKLRFWSAEMEHLFSIIYKKNELTNKIIKQFIKKNKFINN
jgi:hypothetical protein